MTPQERDTLWRIARVVGGWGHVDSEEIRDPNVMAERVKALDDKNINLLLAIQRKNAAILRIEEALEDLHASTALTDVDRANLARHVRSIATLVEPGDATDPLAEPTEEDDE